jgi:hypothetical protein
MQHLPASLTHFSCSIFQDPLTDQAAGHPSRSPRSQTDSRLANPGRYGCLINVLKSLPCNQQLKLSADYVVVIRHHLCGCATELGDRHAGTYLRSCMHW